MFGREYKKKLTTRPTPAILAWIFSTIFWSAFYPVISPIPTIPLPPATPPVRHHRLRWTVISLVGLLVVVLLTTGWLVYRAIAVVNTKKLDGSNTRLSFFQQLGHLITAGDQSLKGESDDRINILLLGIGGPGHDGPYLTDTMIVASYKPSTNQLSLLSIPRDLVVDIPGYDFRKINNVLSFGRDQGYPGGGEALTVKVVSDLLNLPIQYYARVDFTGFKDIIDRLGGVTVNVPNTFDDYQYPDNNYGYRHIHFTKGIQTMSGDQALTYARSRHGTNGEGSDFARARRQQLILFGTKEKMLSFGTLSNPKKISDILGSLGTHSQTNMEVWEMVRLGKLAGQVDRDHVVNKVLDNSANGLLQAETGLGGAFILVPNNRSYSDIQFLAQNIFLIGQAEKEGATITVVNATRLPGLAETISHNLASFGLNVTKPISLKNTTIGNTVMIDLAPGRTPLTDEVVGIYARARGSISLSAWVNQTGDSSLGDYLSSFQSSTNTNSSRNVNSSAATPPTLLLILGQDQPKTPGVTVVPIFKPSQPVAIPVTKKPAATNSSTTKKI